MKKGYAKEGDRLVLVSGQNEEHPDDQNIMKILTATVGVWYVGLLSLCNLFKLIFIYVI